MADSKISALTALAAADVETDADVLAIVDDSATATKKITVDNFRTAIGPKPDTALATTSGTEKDFTIPAWAKCVTLLLSNVSTNGTSVPLVQLGDSGGIETSSYEGSVTAASGTTNNFSAGFDLSTSHSATTVMHGAVVLTLLDASTNTWVASITIGLESTSGFRGAGSKSLSGTLTTVRITMTNGTDAFDAGLVNVIVE